MYLTNKNLRFHEFHGIIRALFLLVKNIAQTMETEHQNSLAEDSAVHTFKLGFSYQTI